MQREGYIGSRPPCIDRGRTLYTDGPTGRARRGGVRLKASISPPDHHTTTSSTQVVRLPARPTRRVTPPQQAPISLPPVSGSSLNSSGVRSELHHHQRRRRRRRRQSVCSDRLPPAIRERSSGVGGGEGA